jgi:transposase-like protein
MMIGTREIATEYRLTHWAGIVRERAESGLTVKAFCESAGLHQNTYFYWQRKLRESVCTGSAAGMLQVPDGWSAIVSAEPNISGTLAIEIGKCRVIADRDTEESLLAKVCRVLVSL